MSGRTQASGIVEEVDANPSELAAASARPYAPEHMPHRALTALPCGQDQADLCV